MPPFKHRFWRQRLCILLGILLICNIHVWMGARGEDEDEEEEGDELGFIDDAEEGEDVDEDKEEEIDDDRETVADHMEELRRVVGVQFPMLHDTDDPSLAAAKVSQHMASEGLQKRLESIFSKTKTAECRQTIAEHMSYFINAIAMEQSLPFSDLTFSNECGETVYMWDDLPEDMHPGMIQNRTYQPPRDETEYLDDLADLKLCFGILTHDNPDATIRLIEALYEPGHVFVVHVDGKEEFESTQKALDAYATTHEHVHILQHPHRVRVNWGGFSMVNATLQILQYAFALDETTRDPLEFHKFVHLSSSSYPLASNQEIRMQLASFPLDANFLNIVMQPIRPGHQAWHYFVECDDALHRIYKLPPLESYTSNADMFTSSQWFIISRDFAEYLAQPEPGSFVHDYLTYIEHVVVADETFFGTVLRHTSFCHQHHNRNFLHLQFDRWESELPAGLRDDRKCPMPNPDHCGRSPTIMTVDYADILELSGDLFARKFDDTVDSHVKDIIDEWRNQRDSKIQKGIHPDDFRPKSMDFEGHGVLIVAKDTVKDETPLCLGLGPTGNALRLTPCFHDYIVPSLSEDWETGAVILEETPLHLRWQVSPCTSDGALTRTTSGLINVTKGTYSTTGPRCMLKQIDGIRAGRCFDGQQDSLQPGGPIQVYPCVQQWFQFVSFGDGEHAPIGSLYSIIPSHIVQQIQNLGHTQSPYMCFGVRGRGTQDERDWAEHNQQEDEAKGDTNEDGSVLPLSNWKGEHLITTQCSNKDAVIEWVFVPYIVEEAYNETVPESDTTTNNSNDEEESMIHENETQESREKHNEL